MKIQKNEDNCSMFDFAIHFFISIIATAILLLIVNSTMGKYFDFLVYDFIKISVAVSIISYISFRLKTYFRNS